MFFNILLGDPHVDLDHAPVLPILGLNTHLQPVGLI